MSNDDFVELSMAKVNSNRNVVISSNNRNGGFTIAQQLIVQDGPRLMTFFLKGAIHVDSINELYDLRDALNDALMQLER